MSENKFTRQDYMSHKCTHRQYYAQFVTNTIKERVKSMIEYWEKHNGPIMCKHFNDVPLHKWDSFGYGLFPSEVAMSTRVCILKEAAKQIKDI